MMNETGGWVKSIHETRYGELLGLVMVGPHVTDMVEAGVVAIDAKRKVGGSADHPAWEVYLHGGRTPTGIDAVEWAREVVARGAGEILLTSIDRDGARGGYDVALTRAIARAVAVPVIASGGAGKAAHVCAAIREGEADAALVAGILHDGVTTVAALKEAMHAAQIPVRAVAA